MCFLKALPLTLMVFGISFSAHPASAEPLPNSTNLSESIIIETVEIPLIEDSEESLKAEFLNAVRREDRLENGTGGTGLSFGELVNSFANLLQKVLAPDTPLLKGTVIAEARPDGFTPMQLQNSRFSGKGFKKSFKSLLGFKLVEVEYKISYSYGADANGVGAYIPYVLFTPLKVVLDPMWHLQVDSLSLTPRNYGTLDNPIAALEFNVAFKAKGITGTLMATDTFSLNAQSGELTADWRDLQP